MAQQKRDLADRRLDGTYAYEMRNMGRLAETAHELFAFAETAEDDARIHRDDHRPQMRQIAADAYALWRLIETTCQPIVEAWEREQDARDTEDVEAQDTEEIADEEWGPEDDEAFANFGKEQETEAERIGWSDDELFFQAHGFK